MKRLLQLYHFLGSIHFAITLIASVTLFVIAGTVIESKTESHRYASHFTYNNPVFIGLLWGFFINILLSALRRWPFQIRHIPFLITHCGLLMILGGALIKSYSGTQGSMGIMEGSASQELFLPDTYVVQVENRNLENAQRHSYPLKQKFMGGFQQDLTGSYDSSDLKIRLVGYSPHSSERLETWFKGDVGVISGFKPFQVYDWRGPVLPELLPVSSRIRLDGRRNEEPILWEVFAGRTSSILELAEKAYLQGLEVILTDTITHEIIYQGALSSLLDKPFPWGGNRIVVALDFSYSPLQGFEDPKLLVTVTHSSHGEQEKIVVPLQGADSLLNLNVLAPYLGKASISIDLKRTPAIVLLQDLHEDIYFFAFDAYGQVNVHPFYHGNLNSLIVYDRGFGGYAVQLELPYTAYFLGRKERERAHLYYLKCQLERSQESHSFLSPPLQMLQKACEASSAEFPACTIDFLSDWNEKHSWLYPNSSLSGSLIPVMSRLDWEGIPKKDRKACFWLHTLFLEIEKQETQGKDLHAILKKMGWPSLSHYDTHRPEEDVVLLKTLTQQVFLVADQLPDIDPPSDFSATMQARLLSAYFRVYSLHLSDVISSIAPAEMQERLNVYIASREVDADVAKSICLECPVTARQRNEIPQDKLEDNLPKIILEVSKGSRKEWVTLTYDKYGQGLKWPIFGGEYLVRFQPQFISIPYRVRLRHARQINYANSSQPFSYESDLIITDREKNSSIEKTISMNDVHETWDGYRFYLASIAPPNEGAVKRVQIVVNHDPAKYFLTYPGAIILTLGIVLLFWMRPYSKGR